jgi:hypothetical protein
MTRIETLIASRFRPPIREVSDTPPEDGCRCRVVFEVRECGDEWRGAISEVGF